MQYPQGEWLVSILGDFRLRLLGCGVSFLGGGSVIQEALPTDARFFAAMLMLREFMHHLHFASVTLQAAAQPD